MDAGVMSFSKIQIDQNFLDEVWRFSPNNLSSLNAETVSKYSIALAQYLIYFKYEQNKTKAQLTKKRKFLESSILMVVDSDLAKKYKTKAAQSEFIINTNPELSKLSEEIEELQLELMKIEGIDKSVSEFIATFKRELSRREKELFATRTERR